MIDENKDSYAREHYKRRLIQTSRINLVLTMYTFFGILASVFGVGFLIYSKFGLELNQSEQFALAITFVGALMAFTAYGYRTFRAALLERDIERYEEQQAVGRFIEAWSIFEETMRKNSNTDSLESDRFSIRDNLNRLKSEGKLKSGELFSAERLLQFRNSLVHGPRSYSTHQINEELERLVRLISKLQ